MALFTLLFTHISSSDAVQIYFLDSCDRLLYDCWERGFVIFLHIYLKWKWFGDANQTEQSGCTEMKYLSSLRPNVTNETGADQTTSKVHNVSVPTEILTLQSDLQPRAKIQTFFPVRVSLQWADSINACSHQRVPEPKVALTGSTWHTSAWDQHSTHLMCKYNK